MIRPWCIAVMVAGAMLLCGCGSDEPQPPAASETPSKTGLAALLEQLGEQPPSDRQLPQTDTTALLVSDNSAGEIDVEATASYLEATIKHADRVWSKWFVDNGLQEPFVGYEIIRPGEQFTTKCGNKVIDSDFPNALYCGADPTSSGDNGVVILPVGTMARMWTGNIFNRQVDLLKRTGDFAAGVIAAHEFGHHVVDSLGQQYGRIQPEKPNSELIADCFAGVWAFHVRLDNYLEEGDIDEALGALAVIGDDKGDHGTGEQRDNAFSIGFTGTQAQPGGGEPLRCIENYWK